ncbi:hypothetical protein ScPMuIL_000111 [Solemya velum]
MARTKREGLRKLHHDWHYIIYPVCATMNFIQKALPIIQRNLVQHCLKASFQLPVKCEFLQSFRPISTILMSRPVALKNISVNEMTKVSTTLPAGSISSLKLVPKSVLVQTMRSYKPKMSLKLRCSGCFYVMRQGRKFVECKLKPRHKQMQIVHKRNLFKDDYSEGNVKKALYWKHKQERWYKQGDNRFARMDWLGDRLGRDI